MKKRFTEEQIIQALKRLEMGMSSKELGRELGVHMQTIYAWKNKYGGMDVPDAKKLKHLEQENTKLKRMIANLVIDIDDLKYINSKNW